MTRVYKYNIPSRSRFSVHIPAGGRFLKAGVQKGLPVLWVLVDEHSATEEYKFISVWTGEDITLDMSRLEYIDTFVVADLVYHLFEIVGQI